MRRFAICNFKSLREETVRRRDTGTWEGPDGMSRLSNERKGKRKEERSTDAKDNKVIRHASTHRRRRQTTFQTGWVVATWCQICGRVGEKALHFAFASGNVSSLVAIDK